ncbi:MAG: ABC transporter substrate-binding protein [Gammaproteobacteria bacterium]|jgi:phospholipid transport system substrate-binding protein|nr:ABC transporter substrate-binding protein [Gammaproteobacteria bacterium]MDH3752061.1 ABC transporter substrate-binding protein [Gammaproteobacteria bacterium]MDH3804840.1 ABC transporter substrate-binding protein [Gammaproteobacteria bacterium]
MKRLAMIVMLASLTLTSADALTAAPDELIREAVDLLEEGLDGRREELAADKDALYDFIDGILLPRFERQFAAMSVLGKHWKTASEQQRNRFIAAFYITLVKRYAEGILEFDTNRIEILPFRGKANGRYSTVKTNVRLDDGTKVPVHYDLVMKKDAWRMYNVKIEGVSYVHNFRTELDAEIKKFSLDAVIERLEGEAGIVADE